MHVSFSSCKAAALVLMLSLCAAVQAAEQPRFQDGAGNVLEALPLEFTEANVQITHGIAAVKLTQTFANRAAETIEAVYLFPGSPSSTVRGLTMTVGDRRIRAQIKKRAAAQQTYDQAKSAGKTASLLKEVQVGTYELNVANILPGDRITVEVDYVELLTPVDGEYRLLLPNTFGTSRYNESRSAGQRGSRTQSNADAVTKDAYFVSARIASGVPVAQVDSPSHEVVSTRVSPYEFQVLLDPSDRRALNRDFELVYRLSGDEVQSGLSLYERDGQGWFLWTMDAPKSVGSAMIPPREFVFVLDVSGSMNGKPMATAKKLMRDLAGVLRPTDYLNAIKFAGGSELMSERSLGATQATVDRLVSFVDEADSGGGTKLLPALEQAFGLPKVAAARTVVIVTDGAIGSIEQSAKFIRQSNGGIGTFVFGVGIGLDRGSLNRLAVAGYSAPFIVDDVGDETQALSDYRAYVDRPLLSFVGLEFQGLTVADVHPQIVPMLYAARPLTVMGRYQPPANGKLIVRGIGAKGAFKREIEVGAYQPDPNADALAFIWARRELDRLILDDQSGNQGQIEQIGLDFGVLTPYTSFVAVDQRVRNADSASTTVNQPTARRQSSTRPPPPPAPNYYAGDLTEALQQLPALGSAAWRVAHKLIVPQHDQSCAATLVAGRQFAATTDGWAQLGVDGSESMIRLRRGGGAWLTLVALHPQVEQWSALGDRVLIKIGKRVLLIADDGFDHYPQERLDKVAATLAKGDKRRRSAPVGEACQR